MAGADVRRALWQCTVRGHLAIRATARYGVLDAEAARFGPVPGFAEADRFVAGVAGVCLAVRTARAGGAGGRTALAAGWWAADPIGRTWLAATVREFAGATAAAELDAAIAAGGPATPALAPRPDTPARHRAGISGWCDVMLTAGFEDVLAIVAPGGAGRTADGPNWVAVEAVADTCHRIPYPQSVPVLLRPWLVRRDLESSWSSTSQAGRSWCRERAARSDVRTPTVIRRIIAAPEGPDVLGDTSASR
ncbi:hypothetical protein ACWEQL_35465 [Kitasatospora sp. NPDC004240]